VNRAIISLVAGAAMVLSPIAALAEEGTSTATQAPLAPGEQCDGQDRDSNGHCIGIPLIVWLGGALVVAGVACAAGGCTQSNDHGGPTQTTGTPGG
jgi:hypothetical protein